MSDYWLVKSRTGTALLSLVFGFIAGAADTWQLGFVSLLLMTGAVVIHIELLYRQVARLKLHLAHLYEDKHRSGRRLPYVEGQS